MLKISIIVLSIIILFVLLTIFINVKKKVINIILLVLILITATMGFLLISGYGFSKKMVLYIGDYGEVYDNLETIRYDDYTFYVLMLDFDNAPKEDKIIDNIFLPVKKTGFLYKLEEYDYDIEYRADTKNDLFGNFVSYKLDNRYINFILTSNSFDKDGRLYYPTVLKVEAEGKEVEVYYYTYFFTDKPVTTFYINGTKVDIYEK